MVFKLDKKICMYTYARNFYFYKYCIVVWRINKIMCVNVADCKEKFNIGL